MSFLVKHYGECSRTGCSCSKMLLNVNDRVESTKAEWYSLLRDMIEG